MKVVALTYHDVVEAGAFNASGFLGADADIYKFERDEFSAHLDAIGGAGPAASVGLIQDGKCASTVLLTFDDGGAGAYSATADLLEARGWRGHFFITTDWIGHPGFLTSRQIRELHQRGHLIGSHSCSHPARMSACSVEELRHEWRDSCDTLSGIVGHPVRTASVPGGYSSHLVAQVAGEAGIQVLFDSEPVVRVRRLAGCLILGRYSIQRGVGPHTVATIASARVGPRLRQYAFWNAKKLIKKVGGAYWIDFRKAWLARRSKT
jgi:peptidoglycan/xylan/chitin deacetylase (PgdA/CDA1 family)